MKIKLLIFIIIITTQNSYTQTIFEGKGVGEITLGIKEKKVKKILGEKFVSKTYENKSFEYQFSNKKINVVFDKDSIVSEIEVLPSNNLKTQKGLKLSENLTLKEVEKIYGNKDDDIYYAYFDEYIIVGYNIGISFQLKPIYYNDSLLKIWNNETEETEPKYLNSKVLNIIIEETDSEKKDYSFYEYINGVYIPENIEEAFSQLDYLLKDSIKTNIIKMTEVEFATYSHFGLGLWIRNNWGLWSMSRLYIFLNTKGFKHPDDMSNYILTEYYSYLKNKH